MELTELFEKNLKVKKIDNKEFSRIKVGMMNFDIYSYEIEGVGFMSVMNMKAMFGLMKMSTIIVNPLKKDAPLFSYDLIKVMGKETLLLELYDTTIESMDVSKIESIKNKYSYLMDGEVKPNWYDYMKMSPSLKKIEKGKTADFEKLTEEYAKAYIDLIGEAKPIDAITKTKKSKEYVDGLLSNGGPSTDVFKKKIGEEKTKELFYNYIFGVERK